MQSTLQRALALVGAVLLAAALLAPASAGLAASKQQEYSARTLMCLKLFFDDPAAHAKECAGVLAPDLKSLGAGGGNGAPPQDDCGPIEGGNGEGAVASDPCVKWQAMFLLEQGGLRFYRFAYEGDDHIYYGVMARELLLDPRFASAVHLSAAGYYTVDYKALGLIVPEEAAMRAAGLRAMDLVAAQHQG